MFYYIICCSTSISQHVVPISFLHYIILLQLHETNYKHTACSKHAVKQNSWKYSCDCSVAFSDLRYMLARHQIKFRLLIRPFQQRLKYQIIWFLKYDMLTDFQSTHFWNICIWHSGNYGICWYISAPYPLKRKTSLLFGRFLMKLCVQFYGLSPRRDARGSVPCFRILKFRAFDTQEVKNNSLRV